MENKLKHPGTIVWEEYVLRDPEKLLNLHTFLSHSLIIRLMKFFNGSILLDDSDLKSLSIAIAVPAYKINSLIEQYKESLKPKGPTDEELITKKLSQVTGFSLKKAENYMDMLKRNHKVEFNSDATIGCLFKKVLGTNSLYDWVEKEKEKLRKKRAPVKCFTTPMRDL